MGDPSKFTVTQGGKFGVIPSGKFSIFNASGSACECCTRECACGASTVTSSSGTVSYERTSDQFVFLPSGFPDNSLLCADGTLLQWYTETTITSAVRKLGSFNAAPFSMLAKFGNTGGTHGSTHGIDVVINNIDSVIGSVPDADCQMTLFEPAGEPFPSITNVNLPLTVRIQTDYTLVGGVYYREESYSINGSLFYYRAPRKWTSNPGGGGSDIKLLNRPCIMEGIAGGPSSVSPTRSTAPANRVTGSLSWDYGIVML